VGITVDDTDRAPSSARRVRSHAPAAGGSRDHDDVSLDRATSDVRRAFGVWRFRRRGAGTVVTVTCDIVTDLRSLSTRPSSRMTGAAAAGLLADHQLCDTPPDIDNSYGI